VVSELRRGWRCNPGLAAWYERVSPEEIYLSVLTLGEIRKGLESRRRRDEPAAAALESWLAGLERSYPDRFLPVDQATADCWGRLNVPDPLPVLDGLLAATAITRGLTLVTRNIRDVERTGVDLLNPFSA
jgi:predicted nucleic acid-binding protein